MAVAPKRQEKGKPISAAGDSKSLPQGDLARGSLVAWRRKGKKKANGAVCATGARAEPEARTCDEWRL
jgi:hypothetical protein